MTNSTHKVEVVPVHLEVHPNADTLSVVRVFGGYPCCVRTVDWQEGELGAYVPPDSVVDSTRPEFAFLAGHERIRAKRLRGQVSMGVLVKAPAGSKVGDDVAERLGVTHYEPPMRGGGPKPPRPPRFSFRHPFRFLWFCISKPRAAAFYLFGIGYNSQGFTEKAPNLPAPYYDLEPLRRHVHVLQSGEPVFITEKIHGANARFCWEDGRMRAGSRTLWRRESKGNPWWQALAAHPEIVAFCKAHQDIAVYAEIYGDVQDLTYGEAGVKLRVFDLLQNGKWLNPVPARLIGINLPWVPTVAEAMPFNAERVLALADGPSLIPGAGHLREGVVVKPLAERIDSSCGRVCFKAVSVDYLERAK